MPLFLTMKMKFVRIANPMSWNEVQTVSSHQQTKQSHRAVVCYETSSKHKVLAEDAAIRKGRVLHSKGKAGVALAVGWEEDNTTW